MSTIKWRERLSLYLVVNLLLPCLRVFIAEKELVLRASIAVVTTIWSKIVKGEEFIGCLAAEIAATHLVTVSTLMWNDGPASTTENSQW